MTQSKEIKTINDKMKGNTSTVPRTLFKYRPFDEHTYDMLENEYLYLCPAKKLDDPSECVVSFDVQDYIDIQTNQLTKYCVEQIMESIRDHTGDVNFRRIQSIIASIMTPDGLVKRNWLLDASFELQELAPNADIVSLVNMLGNIPESINDKQVREQIEQLFIRAAKAREQFGVCSLTTEKNDSAMWKDYANDGTGYCVEYDLLNYKYLELLLPVVYNEQRENNVLMNIVCDFIGQMIIGMSNGQIDADRSRYLRMFLAKDLKWQYQKEWRLIGNAGQKIQAPSIKAVYLGKNVQAVNANKMEKFCNENQILMKKSGGE
ncbi:MAG TPA: hypothetical protein DHU79_01335 [Clostridiales bacterium]|nr:hypothetical protein [Clostridiales bacterium]